MGNSEAITKPTLETLMERIKALGEEMRAGFTLLNQRMERMEERMERMEIRLDRVQSLSLEVRADFREFRAAFKEPA